MFHLESLEELSLSIVRNGLQQAIKVTPRNGHYMIVLGERRWRASRLARLETIRAEVEEMSDRKVQELALIENYTRLDLTPLEEARHFRSMIQDGSSAEKIAALLGLSQSWRVQYRLDLLRLDGQFQQALEVGALTTNQAHEMSKLGRAGQFHIWKAVTAGKCGSDQEFRTMVRAVLDWERQGSLSFVRPPGRLSREQAGALGAAQRFAERGNRLVAGMVGDDLKVLASVERSDRVGPLLAQIRLLTRVAKTVEKALEAIEARNRLGTV